MRPITLSALILLLPVPALGPADGQAQTPEPLEVGAIAPDFTLPAGTRHGLLAEPVSLSDYEGEIVVLSFFFRARTRG